MCFTKVVLQALIITILACKSLFSAEGMPQFNADTFPSQIFWLVLSFVLLYLLVSFLILPRVRDNLRLRKNKISNDLERAELIKLQIEKLVKEYDLKISKAKDRANETLKSAFEKSDQDMSLQIDNIKKKIVKKLSEAEMEALEYKKKISSETNETAAEIAAIVVKKILGQSLSLDEMKLINNNSASGKINES
tara:strand:- start:1964 stop:2542 length:579 start_codon:yes stop_codon:yes gene_type:complete